MLKISFPRFIASANILIFLTIAIAFRQTLYADSHKFNPACQGSLRLEEVILCVLEHSPEYRIAKLDLEASYGKKKSASYIVPSNPTVSGYMGRRTGPNNNILGGDGRQSTINGEILFSQEIYIGGQRQAKINIADSEVRSKVKRLQAIERVSIADTIQATITHQSSWEELQLSDELYNLSKEISRIAKVRFQNGLGSEMDAELAESESLKMLSIKESARRRYQASKADLVVMMGIPSTESFSVSGELRIFPIQFIDLDNYVNLAQKRRPDLEALKLETEVAKNSIKLLQRERIPNLTVSGFVQNDGFNERVVGAKISIPIPIFRNNEAEIQEAEARSKISESRQEVGSHTVRFEAIQAWNNYNSWKRTWESYPRDIISKTNGNLKIIQDAIQMGKIGVRDAIITQKSLVDLKTTYFQTKANYAISCAEYLRASGENFSTYLDQDISIDSLKEGTK